MKAEPKYTYTRAEVAKILGVSKNTVKRLGEEGSLPEIRISPKTIRIHRDALNAYMGAKPK